MTEPCPPLKRLPDDVTYAQSLAALRQVITSYNLCSLKNGMLIKAVMEKESTIR